MFCVGPVRLGMARDGLSLVYRVLVYYCILQWEMPWIFLVLHEYHPFYPPEKSWRSEITYLQRIFHCQMTGKHTSKFLSFIGCLHELSFLCCVIFRIPARVPRNRGTPSYFEYMTATFLVGTLLFLHLDFLKFTLNRAQSRLFFSSTPKNRWVWTIWTSPHAMLAPSLGWATPLPPWRAWFQRPWQVGDAMGMPFAVFDWQLEDGKSNNGVESMIFRSVDLVISERGLLVKFRGVVVKMATFRSGHLYSVCTLW